MKNNPSVLPIESNTAYDDLPESTSGLNSAVLDDVTSRH